MKDADWAKLLSAARKADFFAFVSIVERLWPDAGPIGTAAFPSAERLRLRHSPDLSFSSGDIADATQSHRSGRDEVDDSTMHLTTTFLGLSGAVSPLPLHIADAALDDTGDDAIRHFLDIFHHRALSLLYRWVMRRRISAAVTSSAQDAWSKRLLALEGLDTYDEGTASSLDQRSVYLRLLSPLSSRARSARALERSLAHILHQAVDRATATGDVPPQVRVQQWAGDRNAIDASEQVRLGSTSHRLGRSARIGRYQLDPSSRFIVRIGPLRASLYRQCLKGGALESSIHETISLFCPLGARFQVALLLNEQDAPSFSASLRGDRLGQSTWLRGGSQPKTTLLPIQEPTHAC